MKKKVFSKLTVGLGNQFFQYAAGYSLARMNYADFKYDAVSALSCGDVSNDLKYFSVSSSPCSINELIDESKFFRLPKLVQRIIVGKTAKSYESAGNLFYLEKEGRSDSFRDIKFQSIYLAGHWLDYEYFKDFDLDLRREFRFSGNLNQMSMDVFNQIKKTSSVSVHIRRGDYLAATAINKHGVCSIEYYQEAANFIQSKIGPAVFYVFSDDISWAKDNIRIAKNLVFVDHNDSASACEDFYLMSSCNSHIIANSTFSWWAAHLNCDPNKIVIAPKKWFADQERNDKAKKLIPSGWIRF